MHGIIFMICRHDMDMRFHSALNANRIIYANSI